MTDQIEQAIDAAYEKPTHAKKISPIRLPARAPSEPTFFEVPKRIPQPVQ